MASKTTPKSGSKSGSKPAGKGPRRPTGKPVKPIKPALPWGMIALGTAVALVAVGIIGYGIWSVRDAGKPYGSRASQQIEGLKNFRKSDTDPKRNHVKGKQKYQQSPPVGGDHNAQWQNCEGNVYDKPIASEHAVHSMEHGAVWVTYRPDLPKKQIDELAKKVRGTEYMLMSPYEGLDKPISLQAWGLQLKVDNASDERIDKFIKNFRHSASVEGSTALCSQGRTTTGTEPQEPTGENPGMPQPAPGG
jgi:hypothetical protein